MSGRVMSFEEFGDSVKQSLRDFLKYGIEGAIQRNLHREEARVVMWPKDVSMRSSKIDFFSFKFSMMQSFFRLVWEVVRTLDPHDRQFLADNDVPRVWEQHPKLLGMSGPISVPILCALRFDCCPCVLFVFLKSSPPPPHPRATFQLQGLATEHRRSVQQTLSLSSDGVRGFVWHFQLRASHRGLPDQYARLLD
jgi:hypothetical protein